MKQTEVLDQRIEGYVESLSRALADIEPDEREAMLDDLRGHAAALVEEDPAVDLRARLGDPAVYAHDLRDAAGLADDEQAVGRRLREAWDRAAGSVVGRAARRAWIDFAPAWAAARGVAVVWILAGWLDRAHDHPVVVVVVGAVAGWLLADRFRRLGGGTSAGAVLRGVVDVVVAVTLLLLLVSWTASPDSTDSVAAAEPNPAPGLTLDGSPLSNIQAFGPDGKPTPVALFDQDGSPLDIAPASSANLSCPDGLTAVPVPYLTSAGAPIANAFPARGVCVDGSDVVVQDATPLTNGVVVQSWGTAPMPSRGQTITTDGGGVFAGTVASPTGVVPSASATGAARP